MATMPILSTTPAARTEAPVTAAPVTTWHTTIATPLGAVTLVRNRDGLTGLYFEHHRHQPSGVLSGPSSPEGFEEATRQIQEYFAGTRIQFDLPLQAQGDTFQQTVWDAVARIGHGKTTTYGDIAQAIGVSATPRQVGAVVARNPLCVLVPCHRVVASNGALTGYAGGLKNKRALLDLEVTIAGEMAQYDTSLPL